MYVYDNYPLRQRPVPGPRRRARRTGLLHFFPCQANGPPTGALCGARKASLGLRQMPRGEDGKRGIARHFTKPRPLVRRDKLGTSYRVSLQRGSMKGKLQTSLYPVRFNQPPVSRFSEALVSKTRLGTSRKDVPYTLREQERN